VAERTGRAVVDLAALRANLVTTRSLAGGREVIAVVKADGYGHGAAEVSRALVEAGCTRLAVVDVHEGAALREAGISAPVLVMGGAREPGQIAVAADSGLTLCVHDAEGLPRLREAARRAGRPLGVQVEVDTGMRRMGAPPEHAPALLGEIEADPLLELEGAYTHLASADDPSPESALAQLSAFREVLAAARERGVVPPLIHAANSAALLAGPALMEALPEANAVRPGLMLYGARSADHQDPERRLVPVLSVRSRVAALREAPAGAAVGYSATWRAARATRIATVPIGYADGVLRSLSSCGAVWLAGAVRPIVGRVSMDYVTVDVGAGQAAGAERAAGAARVALGDEVTLIGAPGDPQAARDPDAAPVPGFGPGPGIAVEDQARAAGTLAYELLVRVGERLPRRHLSLEEGNDSFD